MKNIFQYLAKNIFLRSFSTYKNIKILDSISSISDFFPYRNDQFITSYVLENSLAMQSSKKCKFTGELIFFDRNGRVCYKKIIQFRGFDISINLSDFKGSLDEFGGFFVNLIENDLNSKFIPKFRGYTGFSLSLDKFNSYVHGNFGALYKTSSNNFKSLAKISNRFFYYTPQVILNTNQEFFILNPYQIDISVDFYQNLNGNLELFEEKSIPPLGACIFKSGKKRLNGDFALPTFRSKSPSLRAVIFEKCPNGSFDILHS
jgi:hypothetical protein